jgi:sterol desaturase/sphingolipid hydroxylase (fatty acid hydroxylase superfamily)
MAAVSSFSPGAPDVASPRLNEASERARARAVAAIPGWYSPYLHLAATTGVGLVTLVVALASLHAVRLVELLVVPVSLLISNGVEWRAHKSVLHRRLWPVGVLYDRHTPVHHKIYQYDSMAMRSDKEFRLVLIPAAGVASVVAITAPFAYAASRLLSPNCGWLVLAEAGVYVMLYELSHLAYHLPDDSFIGKRALVRVLREHHRRHHHPTLMQKWNFNVTVPLFDWLHGSLASDDLVARVREGRKEAGDAEG